MPPDELLVLAFCQSGPNPDALDHPEDSLALK